VASPDDRLGEALQELRQAAEAELLELLVAFHGLRHQPQ
jgi:hypothetical protein